MLSLCHICRKHAVSLTWTGSGGVQQLCCLYRVHKSNMNNQPTVVMDIKTCFNHFSNVQGDSGSVGAIPSLSDCFIACFVCLCRSWECQAGTSRRTGLQHQHNPPQVAPLPSPPPSPPVSPPVLVPTHHRLLVAGRHHAAEMFHSCCYFRIRIRSIAR